MTTRLDRLFCLLDTGSTFVVRKTAAEQIGNVVKNHPEDLQILLLKLHDVLGKPNWDARIAGGLAVEAIAKQVPKWNPVGYDIIEDIHSQEELKAKIQENYLQLDTFDLVSILSQGQLVGSEGFEYDQNNVEQLTSQEKVERDKDNVKKNLNFGLPGIPDLLDDFVKDEDFVSPESCSSESDGQTLSSIFKKNRSLSVRERIVRKRKAKVLNRQSSHLSPLNDDSCKKRQRSNSLSIIDSRSNSPSTFDNEQEEWPFTKFCQVLTDDLINSSWEKRHGAAIALRHTLYLHGSGAGISSFIPKILFEFANQCFLEDIAVRLMGVLILDRFGDFVSDEVVAPVRESSAQALSIVLNYLNPSKVLSFINLLLNTLSNQQWEVRHGGLLGIKYSMAVRRDLTKEILHKIYPSVFKCLSDLEDDVRSVASLCLVPIIDELTTEMIANLPPLVECLWNSLTSLDDLTSSTSSILILLSKLMPILVAIDDNDSPKMNMYILSTLIPRLFPFFSHNIPSVRKSSLQTLFSLINCKNAQDIVCQWFLPLADHILRLLYQQSLYENNEDILELITQIWEKIITVIDIYKIFCLTSQYLGVWLSLGMQPNQVAFNKDLLLIVKHDNSLKKTANDDDKFFIGGKDAQIENATIRDNCIIRCRFNAAKLLGCFFAAFCRNNIPVPNNDTISNCLINMLKYHLHTKSALQRFFAALVLCEWCEYTNWPVNYFESLNEIVLNCLVEPVYYDEIAILFTKMQVSCKDILASLKKLKVDVSEFEKCPVLTIDVANKLANTFYTNVKKSLPKSTQELDAKVNSLSATVSFTDNEQKIYNLRVNSILASSKIAINQIPEHINPVIRPLMEVIRKEENEDILKLSSFYLSRLLQECKDRESSPNSKIIKNLCNLLCRDQETLLSCNFTETEDQFTVNISKYYGILPLVMYQKLRSSTLKNNNSKKTNEVFENISFAHGAKLALCEIVKFQKANLQINVESLWLAMVEPLDSFENVIDMEHLIDNDSEALKIINCCSVLECLCSYLDKQLHAMILNRLPLLMKCLDHPYTAVRNAAAKCFAMLTKVDQLYVMEFYLENILSILSSDKVRFKQGAITVLHYIIEITNIDFAPYCVLFIVPILGCMSDQDDAVRVMSNQCFAQLVNMMSIENGIPNPPEMKKALIDKKLIERKFLEQLLDGTKLEYFNIPMPIKAELRKYQQDGVNWLAFLNKYKLHGALCDDMGLGKTLQTLCVLAGDHYLKKSNNSDNIISLIVCPPTLTGHWVFEMEKFLDKTHLNALHYTGTPNERINLQKQMNKSFNVVVASYDVVRNDIDFFENINFNYCILDEGHVIKNCKTKLWQSMKRLRSLHRLILSGTPIQNSVLELWSLFDFLMPGYLGTLKQFQARYAKPILASKDAKSSSKEQEAGALAMEALHKQVLPFILRRMKNDVLTDLPPKIIQDLYCDLSSLQLRLYEDFSKSKVLKTVEKDISKSDRQETAKVASNHIFQALQYLRKVCSHPALVLTKSHPKYTEIYEEINDIYDIKHSPKLASLKQLLIDCGIGTMNNNDIPVIGQNRVLIFCQLKSMLDIVENHLLKTHLPSATYLRLDGSIPSGNRHNIVYRFNTDPSIDILLLTTHVGGLGLNLTGANTVIFVEHDWNPCRDAQAMDRAHRIGQKKTVNVYRLITQGTLEEKIMNLQKFKLSIANSIVSTENSSLTTMATDQLLDLFSVGKDEASKKKRANKSGVKNVIENLEELWDEGQYEEFELDKFLINLT